jgi:hypothetical protein
MVALGLKYFQVGIRGEFNQAVTDFKLPNIRSGGSLQL